MGRWSGNPFKPVQGTRGRARRAVRGCVKDTSNVEKACAEVFAPLRVGPAWCAESTQESLSAALAVDNARSPASTPDAESSDLGVDWDEEQSPRRGAQHSERALSRARWPSGPKHHTRGDAPAHALRANESSRMVELKNPRFMGLRSRDGNAITKGTLPASPGAHI